VFAPLSGVATSGIEAENAGSAPGLFNMMHLLGGAVGIAMLQTFLTKREQYHSDLLSQSVSLLEQAPARGWRIASGSGFPSSPG
jgi:MFS transporter, DHA2 family, multidrug resistance protein